MSVNLLSKTYTNPLDSSPVNWLLANVGDQVVIEHIIYIREIAIASSENIVVLNNIDGYISANTCTGLDFSKFKVGDTVDIVNYATYTLITSTTVLALISSTEIVFSSVIPGGSSVNRTDVLFCITNPITALSYQWNFIENTETTNYYSKVDGSLMKASVGGLNAGVVTLNIPMALSGDLPYQNDTVTVDTVSISTLPAYTSTFKIKHTTRITPIMLAEQWDDLQAGIKPDYYFNLNCLKHVYFIEARYNLLDPTRFQYMEDDASDGNTGWFNEKYNANLTNYSVSGLLYKDNVTAVVYPKIKMNLVDKTDFEFYINNTTNSPFVATSTKLVLNFAKAPNDQTEYQANGRDLKHNFVWDSALLTVAVAPVAVNGDNYADTTMRSLYGLKATYISTSQIKITGTFVFHANSKAVFEESDEPRYLFFASIQDHTKVGAVSDRVTLKVDSAPFYYQSMFPALISMTSKLIPHDVNSPTSIFLEREHFAEDELVGYTEAVVGTDKDVTSILLTRHTSKIIAFNTVTLEEFTLESKTVLLPAVPYLAGYQVFNIVQAKPFHVPTAEIRKYIKCKSNITAGAGVGLYEFTYPFMIRWEYWEALLSGASYFYNPASPFNGLNHDWQHYYDFANDWVLQYVFELGTKINGVPAVYTNKTTFDAYDRNLVGENTTCVIDTYDATTLAPLVSGGTKYILGYANTLVKAVFTNTVDTFVLTADTTVVIGIEVFEEGGENGKRRMSSRWVSDADTWFIPLTGETKTKLTFTSGNTICTAETELDYSQIAGLVGKDKWKLTARIYGNVLSGTSGVITHGQNYLGSQEVRMIASNPIITETIVTTPKVTDCCSDFVWRVLADTATSNELKNDKNNFLWWFNKDAVATAVVSLIKPDLTEVVLTASTTYGTPYDYGFKENSKKEYLVGYLIDWRKVLIAFGEGIYQLKCEATTIFSTTSTLLSASYCLKQFTNDRANGTVRVEYELSGLIGYNKQDEELRDYADLVWQNQHRFDGVFYYTNSSYNGDEIQYQNGQLETVEDGQTPEYILDLKSIPAFKHDILRTDIYQSNKTLITDYNDRNIDNYYKKNVKKNGTYDPTWYPLKSKVAPVKLKFKQGFNNLKKFRS